jgi:hypothetical protein
VNVLIGCETSGRTREAFRIRGHNAWSCDVLPSEDNSIYHLRCDVRLLLTRWYGWDLAIFHPDCTYLTNSAEWAYSDGPYHQKIKSETLVGADRRAARERAVNFVRQLWDAPIEHIAIENPVGVLSSVFMPPTQYIQPNEYGDDASKKTCLWLKNLPTLQPTCHIPPRITVDGKLRWGNQTDSGQNKLSPGPDRWKERSRTYTGWSEAFADQWGSHTP